MSSMRSSRHSGAANGKAEKEKKHVSLQLRTTDKAAEGGGGGGKGDDIAKAVGSALDETINLEVLMQLKSAFHRADTDGGGNLSIEEFVEAFADVTAVSTSIDEIKLRQLFTRIDANVASSNPQSSKCEREGVSELTERRTLLRGSEYVEQQPPDHGGNEPPPDPLAKHKDLVTRIVHLPARDSYATTSRDGTVRLWSTHVGNPLQRKAVVGTAYLTDCAHLPTSHRLAVACFNRCVKIFEPMNMDQVGVYTDLNCAPLSVNTWAGGRRAAPAGRDMDYMVVGDDGGYVHALKVIDKTDSEKSPGNLVRFEEMWKEKTHDDWVNRVLYLTELDAVGSCSLDRNICITDVERRAAVRTLSGHTKGVYAMDWSPKYKFIASCGMDRNVLLWNPFSVKSIGQLSGHTSSVVDLVIVEAENQIITLGMDKTVKVWDIRNHKCLQTFHDRQAYRPENRLGSMLYDDNKRALVAASVQPKTWRLITKDRTTSAGHSHPCVASMFNDHFQQVVTADQAGTVCVWDVHTGDIDFRFQNAHGDGKLTAAGFDGGGRRLITGGSDGRLLMWNFSNGHKLKELTSPTDDEVTAVVHTGGSNQKRIVGVGWNRLVTFWDDDERKKAPCSRQLRGHAADVLCIAQAPPSVLATGDFDGVVIIWNVESGAVRHKLTPPPIDNGGEEGTPSYAPATDRAAESLCFVSLGKERIAESSKEWGATPLPLVLASSYADGYVRFWNATEGRCVGAFHAGHRRGESVLSIATDPSGTRMVTGDSRGRVRLWDISRVAESIFQEWKNNAAGGGGGGGGGGGKGGGGGSGGGGGRGEGGGGGDAKLSGRDDVKLLGYWQAHKTGMCVNAVDFFELEDVGSFFLTAAEDASVHMWSAEGQHVGKFGGDQWRLADYNTWRSLEPPKGGDEYTAEKAAREEEERAVKTAGDAEAAKKKEAEATEAKEKAKAEGAAAAAAAAGGAMATLKVSQQEAAAGAGAGAAAAKPLSGGPGPFSKRAGVSPSPSTSNMYPEPSGYLPVRPEDDRRMWTYDVEESYENSDFFKRMEELKEKEDVSLDELKARHRKLHKKQPAMHHRVYIPEGDKHINHPKIPGRPYTSLHHLVNIRDLRTLGPRPVSSRGKFQYGKSVDLADEANSGEGGLDGGGGGGVGGGGGGGMAGSRGGGRSAPAMGMASNVHAGMMGASGPGGSVRPATGRATRTEALAESLDEMAAAKGASRPPTAAAAAAAGMQRIESGRRGSTTPSGGGGSGRKSFNAAGIRR